MLYRCEIFRFAPNSDARARSGAFSRQVFYAARMSGIFLLASLVGSGAQDLADAPETTNLRSPARRGDLFQERTQDQRSSPVPKLFCQCFFRSGLRRWRAQWDWH